MVLSLFSEEIAITFDDLPFVHQGRYSLKDQEQHFLNILKVLDRYHIKATGFVIGQNVTDPFQIGLLNEFRSRGHTVGNHSFSHPDLNKVSVEQFTRDALKFQEELGFLMNPMKYFRYPMLHRGNSEEKKDGCLQIFGKERLHHCPRVHRQ